MAKKVKAGPASTHGSSFKSTVNDSPAAQL